MPWQDRLSALVPILSTIEDRLGVLRNSNTGMLSREWQKLMDDIADWAAIGVENEPGNAIRLRKRIDNATPVISADSHWEDMLLANLAAELYRLVDICEDCFDLSPGKQYRPVRCHAASRAPQAKGFDNEPARGSPPRALVSVRRHDGDFPVVPVLGHFRMADGLLCPDDGRHVQHVLRHDGQSGSHPQGSAFYTLLSTPVAGLYLLLFLPSAHSFEMMMLVFAPFLLWFGTYLSKPATMIKVIPFMFTTLATLTMFDMGSANMTSFINSQVSQAIGAGMAVLFTALFRIANIEAITRRLVKTMWTDISRLGKAIRAPSVMEVSVRMVDGTACSLPVGARRKMVSQANPVIFPQ